MKKGTFADMNKTRKIQKERGKRHVLTDWILSLLEALLVIAVFALVPFAWLMRDGLGPDAVESSGVHAI